MEIQFNFISYIVMAIFYGISGLFIWFLWHLFKHMQWRKKFIYPFSVFILLLPWLDEVWIAYRFGQLCKGAGIHVERQVVVDGYYDASKNDNVKTSYLGEDKEFVKRMNNKGFKYMERRTFNGKVRHMEASGSNRVETILDKPRSRYHYRHTDNHKKIEHQITFIRRDVWDSRLDEIVATSLKYSRYPGWLDSLWIYFFGTRKTKNKGVSDNGESFSTYKL